MRDASEQPLRIVIADDHPIFLIGLRAVLERDEQVRIVGEATSPQALAALLQRCPCDVLVTDFMMPAEPQADGLRLIEHLRRHYPDLPIVVVTMLNNAGLFHSILELGVMGLLSKASLPTSCPKPSTRCASSGPMWPAPLNRRSPWPVQWGLIACTRSTSCHPGNWR